MMEIQGTDWKFSESPLVHGNRVIVTPGSSTAALVALDKTTGKELWRTAIPDLGEKGGDGAGYSSVVVSNAAGVEQYVRLLGRGLIGVEAATGKLLWSYNRVANEIANIATPLVYGDHVFVSTGYGTGSALLKIESGEGGLKAKELYFLDADTMQNHHGGLVRDGDQIYTGTGHNKGFPLALHWKSGEVAWGPIRNAGKSSAAIAFADGHLYFRYQDGLMVLIQATAEGYEERGSFQIPDVKRESWSHPVIAEGLLYLKEQQKLYVYDLRAGRSK
jgi:outer membrane protein assembly factor BamB